MRHYYEFPNKSIRWYVHVELYVLENAIMNANITYNMANPETPLYALTFRGQLVDRLLALSVSLQVDMYKERRLDHRVLYPIPAHELTNMGSHVIQSAKHARVCMVCKKKTRHFCVECNAHVHKKDCYQNYHEKLVRDGGVYKKCSA